MASNGKLEYEAVPPTPECEPYTYCPFTNNGAYHGVCLWHEGPKRTCACGGQTQHIFANENLGKLLGRGL